MFEYCRSGDTVHVVYDCCLYCGVDSTERYIQRQSAHQDSSASRGRKVPQAPRFSTERFNRDNPQRSPILHLRAISINAAWRRIHRRMDSTSPADQSVHLIKRCHSPNHGRDNACLFRARREIELKPIAHPTRRRFNIEYEVSEAGQQVQAIRHHEA